MTEADWTLRLWRFLDANNHEVAVGRERRLWDNTRVDILTKDLACEVDWARKWAEAAGQVVWYAHNCERTPVMVLLSRDPVEENRFIYRGQVIATKLEIVLWVVDTTRSQLVIGVDRFDI